MRLSAVILPVLGRLTYACIGDSYEDWDAVISSEYGGNCYSDLQDIRTLWGIAQGLNSSAMTVEACLDACGSQGYNLAGVEYSQECWCGNSIQGPNAPITSSSCNMPCTGDPAEMCGGAAAMNLWVRNNFTYTHGPASLVQGVGNYLYTTCWEDYDSNNRPLMVQPPLSPPANNMTVEGCIIACAADGWTSAGLEYASQCFCGNESYPIGESATDNCNMPCTGDASQFCGDPNRMMAYYDPSGPSVPTITPTSTPNCAPTPTGLTGLVYGDFECGGSSYPWTLSVSEPSILNATITGPGLTGDYAVYVTLDGSPGNCEGCANVVLTSPFVLNASPSTAYKLTWGNYAVGSANYIEATVNGEYVGYISGSQYDLNHWVYAQMPWNSLSTDFSAQVSFEWDTYSGTLDTVVLSEISAWCGDSPPLGIMPDGEFECGLGAWTQEVPDPTCLAGVGSNAAATGGTALGNFAWVATEPENPVTANLQDGVSARIISPTLTVVPGVTYMLSFVTYFTEDQIGFIGVQINPNAGNGAGYTRDPADGGQNGPTAFSPNTVFWTNNAGATTVTIKFEALFATAGTMMVDGVIFTPVNSAWSGAYGE